MKLTILRCAKGISLVLTLLCTVQLSHAQDAEKTSAIKHFSGSVLVTNNGISSVPSFSLGKPAVIFDLSMGGDKLRFEPQFRFAMEGKPWSFIFWFRHKTVDNEKFSLSIGAHPAILFRDVTFEEDGAVKEGLEGRRFLAGEIDPSIKISKHIDLKPYYLVGHGFDRGLQNTHYMSMRIGVSDLEISEQLLFSFTPEIYYLITDGITGSYCGSSFSVEHRELPFTLGAKINQKIESDIVSDDFLWNVSLTYSFGD